MHSYKLEKIKKNFLKSVDNTLKGCYNITIPNDKPQKTKSVRNYKSLVKMYKKSTQNLIIKNLKKVLTTPLKSVIIST